LAPRLRGERGRKWNRRIVTRASSPSVPISGDTAPIMWERRPWSVFVMLILMKIFRVVLGLLATRWRDRDGTI
jgi:hypothetical protein